MKNNKTRFFYVLYSDKTWVFDQSERAYYPIYIINIYIYIYNLHGISLARTGEWTLMVGCQSSRLNQNKPFSGPVLTLMSSSAEFLQFQLVWSLTHHWT